MTPQALIWIYIILLVAGGLAGFIKAGSRVSLVSSLLFACLLSLCQLGALRPYWITYLLLGILLAFFGSRFIQGKKFMPAGLMTILTLAALLLLLLL